MFYYTSSVKYEPASHRQITFNGQATFPIISPDGQFIAYIKGDTKLMYARPFRWSGQLNCYKNLCLYFRFGPMMEKSSLFQLWMMKIIFFKIILIPRLGGQSHVIGEGVFNCWAMDGEWIASAFADLKQIALTNIKTLETKTIALKQIRFLWGLDWSQQKEMFLVTRSG